MKGSKNTIFSCILEQAVARYSQEQLVSGARLGMKPKVVTVAAI